MPCIITYTNTCYLKSFLSFIFSDWLTNWHHRPQHQQWDWWFSNPRQMHEIGKNNKLFVRAEVECYNWHFLSCLSPHCCVHCCIPLLQSLAEIQWELSRSKNLESYHFEWELCYLIFSMVCYLSKLICIIYAWNLCSKCIIWLPMRGMTSKMGGGRYIRHTVPTFWRSYLGVNWGQTTKLFSIHMELSTYNKQQAVYILKVIWRSLGSNYQMLFDSH